MEYHWDSKAHSPYITVLEDERHTCVREVAKQSTDGVRGRIGVSSGRHVFHFQFNDKPWGSHCSIGVCSEKTKMRVKGYDDVLGLDPDTWAWDIPSRELLHAHTVIGDFGKEMDVPKSVTMTLDLDTFFLTFDIGTAKCNIDLEGVQQKKLTLYPAAAMVYGLTELKIKLLETTTPDVFKLPPEDTTDKTTSNDKNSKSKRGRRLRKNKTDDKAVNGRDANGDNPNVDAPSKDTDKLVDKTVDDNVKNGDIKQPSESTIASQTSQVTQETVVSGAPGNNEKEVATPLNITEPDTKENAATKEKDGKRDKEKKTNARPGIRRNETLNIIVTEEAEKGADRTINLDALIPEDRVLIQVCHAWDNTARGGKLEILPNAPNICIPAANSEGYTQAIRGRSAFTKGNHIWTIRQYNLVAPSEENADIWNQVLIGIADAEHRSFNYGFSLSQVGKHAWCWEPSSGRIWHGEQCIETPAIVENINWKEGIECNLDVCAKTIKFVYKHHKVRLELPDVTDRALYPFVVVHCQHQTALHIAYKGGFEDHLLEKLNYMQTLSRRDYEELVAHRALCGQPGASAGGPVIDDKFKDCYVWGDCTANVTVAKPATNEVTVETSMDRDITEELLFAEKLLTHGKHTIDLLIPRADHLIIALVGQDFDHIGACWSAGGLPKESSLIRSEHSWAWDVTRRQLYYGGVLVGQYPSFAFDLDSEKVQGFRLNVLFAHSGTASVTFAALTEGGYFTDLGVAFVYLRNALLPAMSVGIRQGSAKVSMHYRAGPEAFLNTMKPKNESKVCTIS